MSIELTSETEALVLQKVEDEHYPDADTVVREALAALNSYDATHSAWFKEEALKGFESLERKKYGRSPDAIKAAVLQKHKKQPS